MIKYLLQEIEKAPNPLFTKKELLSISPKDFRHLCKRKILVYCRPTTGDTEQLRYPRCEHGCPLTVVRVEGRLEAVCLDHPEKDPILVDKDDLSRYAFSMEQFLFEVRSANRIDGDLSRIQGGHFYMGYKHFNDSRVGFAFVQKIGDEKTVKLSGLRHLCQEDDILVVLTPKSRIEDVTLKAQLRSDNIVQTSLFSSLDLLTFKLPIEELISGQLKPKAVRETRLVELSPKQKSDYEKHKYQCYDEIHILGGIPGDRSNRIVVNGNEVKLGDSLLLLFLRLVAELKKKEGGWINIHDLKSEGIIGDPEKYQIYSNLRSAIQGSLWEKDGRKFIQAGGSKNYRVSTHPDFITYDKKKLLKHPDHRIKELSSKLPQR